jgi:hypothetical protein
MEYYQSQSSVSIAPGEIMRLAAGLSGRIPAALRIISQANKKGGREPSPGSPAPCPDWLVSEISVLAHSAMAGAS